jgi:hypothetical protein
VAIKLFIKRALTGTLSRNPRGKGAQRVSFQITGVSLHIRQDSYWHTTAIGYWHTTANGTLISVPPLSAGSRRLSLKIKRSKRGPRGFSVDRCVIPTRNGDGVLCGHRAADGRPCRAMLPPHNAGGSPLWGQAALFTCSALVGSGSMSTTARSAGVEWRCTNSRDPPRSCDVRLSVLSPSICKDGYPRTEKTTTSMSLHHGQPNRS